MDVKSLLLKKMRGDEKNQDADLASLHFLLKYTQKKKVLSLN